MRRIAPLPLAALLAAALLAASGLPAGAEEALAPWQMVRSLQLVQDRIADGDQAALPMQRHLLGMIDARLRTASPAELAEPRNFQAVLIYGMGGGNPATIQALMPDLLAAADALDAPPPVPKAEGEEGEKEAADAGETAEPAKAEEHGESAEDHGGSHGTEAGSGEAAPQGEASEAHAAPEPEKPAEHAEASEESHGGGHGDAAEEEHGGGHGEEAGAEEAAPSPPTPQKRKMALGVFNYGRGRFRDAKAALGPVDPLRETPELGAFLALVKGSLDANEDPAAAVKLLDQARLMGTGTLVEEAALRRSVALAATLGERPRFLRASGQYVRRFLHSPYASQFADAFVAGVVVLHEDLDLGAVAEVASGMTPEQERVIFLRIARRAAIDNLVALSQFASAKAGATPGAEAPAGDPRAALYAALPDVTAADPAATLSRLRSIDAGGLTAGDRALLDAAKAVAAETLAPPAPVAADDAPPAPAPSPTAPAAPAGAAPAGEGTAPDPSGAKLAEARKALEAVDQLLQESTE